VMELTHKDIGTRYAELSVRDDRPEAVLVTLADARQVPAWCDTLPRVTGSRRNTGYALRLVDVAQTLAFPGAYLDRLQRLAQSVSAWCSRRPPASAALPRSAAPDGQHGAFVRFPRCGLSVRELR
jgi:hypothetical protein